MEEALALNPTLLAVMAALFLVGTFLLWKVFWKPLVNIMETREERIRTDLSTAEDARRKMEALKDEYTAKLREIEDKAAALIGDATREAREKAAAVEAASAEEINRRKEAALAELERQRAAAIASLRAEVADLAVTVARSILKREVSKEDHSRFVSEFLSEIESRDKRN